MYQSKHLTKDQKIKLGSFYTPKFLVEYVFSLIEPYRNKDTVIIDNAAGFGAFISGISDANFRAADCDEEAYSYLSKTFEKQSIFFHNSLVNVSRAEYNIGVKNRVIVVGNPPYNDTTSEFRNGRKGNNICDPDLYDRDLGVSFLKSYDKLMADYVCVLHPLSYLIKETNFLRLKQFSRTYRLLKGLVFSSSEFAETGSAKFPIVIALYERCSSGMDFEFIKKFPFEILGEEAKFILSDFLTTDGLINKYPPRKSEVDGSDIDLYFYTFRDMNSLKRNKGFIESSGYNNVVVNLRDLHKYSYLNALKFFFEPKDSWLYGNLSPLLFEEIFYKYRDECIIHALQTNKTLLNKPTSLRNKIIDYYNLDYSKQNDQQKVEALLKRKFSEQL